MAGTCEDILAGAQGGAAAAEVRQDCGASAAYLPNDPRVACPGGDVVTNRAASGASSGPAKRPARSSIP